MNSRQCAEIHWKQVTVFTCTMVSTQSLFQLLAPSVLIYLNLPLYIHDLKSPLSVFTLKYTCTSLVAYTHDFYHQTVGMHSMVAMQQWKWIEKLHEETTCNMIYRKGSSIRQCVVTVQIVLVFMISFQPYKAFWESIIRGL